ncbi:MAG: choice-of-anchor Q domain-containing protein [Verrucomicrobiales bacterium]
MKTKFNIENCIVAKNAISDAAALGPDILNNYDGGFGNVSDPGVNLMTDVSDSGYAAATFMIVADPLLGDLADNGGPTRTVTLLDGSPAIDAGSSTSTSPTDQRGAFRPSGGLPDLGSLEIGGTTGFAGWALTKIPAASVQAFDADPDGDGLGNGSDYALGSDPFSSLVGPNFSAEVLPDGTRQVSFGLSSLAKADAAWALRRSVNLKDYTEMYRYAGPTESEAIGNRQSVIR